MVLTAATCAGTAATLWALLLTQAAHQASAAEKNYEWAGSFETPGKDYAWTMQNKDKKGYEDMKLVIVKIDSADYGPSLDAVEAGANELLEKGPCTPVSAWTNLGPLTPSSTTMIPGNCYQLKPDATVYSNVFKLDLSASDNTAFFAEHVPTEFERSAHYLIDADGVDIEPVIEIPEKEDPDDYSGVWGATLVVELVTLVGLLTLVPGIKGLMENEDTRAAWLAGSSSFAAGALLAAAAFLMIPESVLLVNADEDLNEGEASARLGICLLCGFAVGLVIDFAVTAFKGPTDATEAVPPEKTDEETPGETEPALPAPPMDMTNVQFRTATSIFVGDFLHNLGDGFFIGAAFRVCGNSMGWTVAWATVAHELAQEFADYFVLVGPAGLSWWKAILLNMLSGVSVVIGGLAVYGSDIDNTATGLVLVFGAGTYIYIGCVEAIPRAFAPEMSPNLKMLNLFLFVVGCAGIAFVLYGHEHCEGDGGHAH